MGAIIGGVSALLGVGGSLLASSQQQSATHAAQSNLNPFYLPGQRATNALMANLGLIKPMASEPSSDAVFQASPGYQWLKDQGIDAIQNSAASRDGVVSGNTLKALQSFGTGLANQDYQQWIDNLARMSSLGENAAVSGANIFTQGGNAAAAGTVGATNALTNLLPFLNNMFQSNPGSVDTPILSGNPSNSGFNPYTLTS